MREEILEWVKSIVIAVVVAILIRVFIVEVFLVDGNSMMSTLQHNERLIVNKFKYHFQEPEHGEVVIFSYSNNRDFIKRVIALENDKLEIKRGQVYINDEPVDEDYIYQETQQDFGPVIIPDGEIFVMGDNRNNSMDSRDPNVGSVSLEQVKGKAFLVFWPLSNLRLIKHY